MSELKTNQIATNDGNNVAIDNSLNLKSYTTTQRDALTSAAGDLIYNSTDSEVQVFDGSSWASLGAITQGASISVDYLVAAGGGGGGEHGSRGAGGGGAGGVANSYNSETCGRFARSYSALSLYKNLRYNVSIGSGGAGGTAANIMPYHGNGSNFHTVSVPGGSPGSDGHANGGRSHYGGSGGGGGGGGHHGGGNGRGNETYGYDGGGGYSSNNNWQGGGGGGIGGNGSSGVSGSGGAGGVGKVFTILSSSNATTASVGEVSGTDVYYGGGGGGSGYSSTAVSSGGLGGGGDGNVSSANDALNEGSPNTGGGGGAKGAGTATDAGSGGSGVVILRYPNTATINTIGLTSQTFTEGSDKVTVITAGTGQVYWE